MLLKLDPDQEATIRGKLKKYNGNATTIESAAGAIVIGQLYGWRVLKMVHNPSTYRRYEKILGIRFEDVCPEETDLSSRNIGVKAAKKLRSFWAVVRGSIEVKRKGYLE